MIYRKPKFSKSKCGTYAPHFLFMLILLLPLAAHAQKDTLVVFGSKKQPLPNVYILNESSNLIGVTNNDGEALLNATLHKLLLLKHIGYKDTIIPPFKGTVAINMIASKQLLQEVNIQANRIRRLDSITPTDFVVINKTLYIAQSNVLYAIDISNWVLIDHYTMDNKIKELELDCNNNLFTITKNYVTHLLLFDYKLNIKNKYTLTEYYNNINICNSKLSDQLLLIAFDEHNGFKKNIGLHNTQSNQIQLFYTTFNKEAYKYFIEKERALVIAGRKNQTKVQAKSKKELQRAKNILDFNSEKVFDLSRRPIISSTKLNMNEFAIYDSYHDTLIKYRQTSNLKILQAESKVLNENAKDFKAMVSSCDNKLIFFILKHDLGYSLQSINGYGNISTLTSLPYAYNDYIFFTCDYYYYFSRKGQSYIFHKRPMKSNE